MSSRDIRAALNRRSIGFKKVAFEWTLEAGEMVGVYIVELTEDSADHFGEYIFKMFDNTQHALDWIEKLELFKEAPP